MPYNQSGNGKCTLCGSAGTNKTTCPLNPNAKNPNPLKHPLAKKSKSKILPKDSKFLQLKGPGKDVARPSIKPILNTMKIKKKTINNNINTMNCKKYENIINLNLDNINLKDSNKNIKLVTLEYNNNILEYNKFLNKGAYGEVYEFSNNEYKVAIKVYKESDDNEIDIIKKINKSKISCNIVNSKLLKINNTYISVMDLMNGGLSKMNGKLNNNNIILCIKNIAKHLKCLNDNKLAYTDLKTDNILFKCKNKKNIEIALGDLGSICEIGKNNACTWNPWEYRNELGFPKCNESTMVWCLGVVLCELLNVSVTLFHWSEIAKYDDIDINTYIEKICIHKKLNNNYIDKSKNYSIEKLLKNMLNLDPKKRIKLNTIINNINL